MDAAVLDPAGTTRIDDHATGSEDPVTLGKIVAARLIERGAKGLLGS